MRHSPSPTRESSWSEREREAREQSHPVGAPASSRRVVAGTPPHHRRRAHHLDAPASWMGGGGTHTHPVRATPRAPHRGCKGWSAEGVQWSCGGGGWLFVVVVVGSESTPPTMAFLSLCPKAPCRVFFISSGCCSVMVVLCFCCGGEGIFFFFFWEGVVVVVVMMGGFVRPGSFDHCAGRKNGESLSRLVLPPQAPISDIFVWAKKGHLGLRLGSTVRARKWSVSASVPLASLQTVWQEGKW